MRMGDEHDVDLDVLDEVGHFGRVAVEEAEPIDKQRVRENADAIDLDEDGRVSEVTNMREHRPSVMLW
jgi:hypothetical protein